MKCASFVARLVLLVGLATPAMAAEPVAAAEIISQWLLETGKNQPLRVSWTHPQPVGVGRFSRFQTEWAGSDDGRDQGGRSLLRFDRERFRLETTGFSPPEHAQLSASQQQQIPTLVRQELPERFQEDWALYRRSSFERPAIEYRSVRPVQWEYGANRLTETWPKVGDQHPRVTRFPRQIDCWSAWYSAFDPVNHDARHAAAHVLAAGLAACPEHPWLDIVNRGGWKSAGEPVRYGRDICTPVVSIPNQAGDPKWEVWLASDSPPRIRRLFRRTAEELLQIDFHYESAGQDAGSLPVAWDVLILPSGVAPVQSFSRAVNVQWEINDPDAAWPSDQDHPVGAFVEDADQGTTYIVLPNGARREVTRGELLWLPTYSELLASESGKAGDAVAAEIRRREWRRAYRIPAAVCVGAAVIASLWWIQRRRRGAAPTTS